MLKYDKTLDRYTFSTAGWSEQDELWFEPGVCECGAITDGVAIGHDDGCGFVLTFDDLKYMYEAAVEAREGGKQCVSTK